MQSYTTKSGLMSTSFGSIKIKENNKIHRLSGKNMVKSEIKEHTEDHGASYIEKWVGLSHFSGDVPMNMSLIKTTFQSIRHSNFF